MLIKYNFIFHINYAKLIPLSKEMRNNMLITKNTSNLTYNITTDLIPFNLNDCVFFDIETTGLSSTNNMVYLIGILTYSNSQWHSIQYLATNLDDEKAIINSFFKLLTDKKYLIHYNGNHFDIPFINKRAAHHQLTSPINKLESIDLYKLSKSLDSFLKLNNYKLCTITNALKIPRADKLSGKELIKVYYDFVKAYSLDLLKKNYTKSDSYKKLLLIHNYEDIINLPTLLNLYSYSYMQKGNFSVNNFNTDNNTLTIECTLQTSSDTYFLPIDLNYTRPENNSFQITSNKSNLLIRVPIFNLELKFFYPNYKDYYYLPDEDIAIHKSVGQYVDKDHRIQASASNCYTKRAGIFIYNLNSLQNIPIFRQSYNDKTSYVELTSSILTADNIKAYVLNLLSIMQ